jgi:hypothetical protein
MLSQLGWFNTTHFQSKTSKNEVEIAKANQEKAYLQFVNNRYLSLLVKKFQMHLDSTIMRPIKLQFSKNRQMHLKKQSSCLMNC